MRIVFVIACVTSSVLIRGNAIPPSYPSSSHSPFLLQLLQSFKQNLNDTIDNNIYVLNRIEQTNGSQLQLDGQGLSDRRPLLNSSAVDLPFEDTVEDGGGTEPSTQIESNDILHHRGNDTSWDENNSGDTLEAFTTGHEEKTQINDKKLNKTEGFTDESPSSGLAKECLLHPPQTNATKDLQSQTNATTITGGNGTQTDEEIDPSHLHVREFYTLVMDALLVVVSEEMKAKGNLDQDLNQGPMFALSAVGDVARRGEITIRDSKSGRRKIVECDFVVGPMVIIPAAAGQMNPSNQFSFYVDGNFQLRLKRERTDELGLYLDDLEVGSSNEDIHLDEALEALSTPTTYEVIQNLLLRLRLEETMTEAVMTTLRMPQVVHTISAVPEFLPHLR